jgi:protein TonB
VTSYATPSPSVRILLRALLASLVLHVALLVPGRGIPPDDGSRQADTRPVRARLAPKSAVTPPEAKAPPAETVTPERTPAPARPAPRPPENPPAAPADPVESVAPDSAVPRQELASPESLRPRVDLGGLRQYHLSLGHMARRFRTYPPALREAGAGGRVTVRLAVAADGRPFGLILLNSSGHAELDEAAMEMIRLAASHTPVPDSLIGQPFTIDLALDYDPTAPP